MASKLPLTYAYPSQVKQKLSRAHGELLRHRYLTNVTYGLTREGEDKVIYDFAAGSTKINGGEERRRLGRPIHGPVSRESSRLAAPGEDHTDPCRRCMDRPLLYAETATRIDRLDRQSARQSVWTLGCGRGFLQSLLQRQAAGGEIFPVDVDEYKKLASHRVRRADKAVTVTVPDDPERVATAVTVLPNDVCESSTIQALLAEIGIRMGMQSWIPREIAPPCSPNGAAIIRPCLSGCH